MEARRVSVFLRWIAGIVDKTNIPEENLLPPRSFRRRSPGSVIPFEIVVVSEGTATCYQEVHRITSQYDLVENWVFLSDGAHGARRIIYHPTKNEDDQENDRHSE